jgi:DTW domain-containing protein
MRGGAEHTGFQRLVQRKLRDVESKHRQRKAHRRDIVLASWAPVSRERCFQCFRPCAQCLCSKVVRIPNRTEVVILQHPRERRHPFNTARLLELCLERSVVAVDYSGELRSGAQCLPNLEGAVLLYPGPKARPLSSLPRTERPRKLLVIDGTWHQAHSLYRDIAPLHHLPQVTLDVAAPSAFEIRRQPARHCLSTLEAVHRSLSLLEPETQHLDTLLDVFRAMVQQQLKESARNGRVRKGRRERGDLPRALSEDFQDLVVAYAETAQCDDSLRALVSVSALKIASGEVFDFVFQRSGIAPGHLRHMGLEPEDIARGRPASEFAHAWSAFVNPTDVVGVWSDTTLSALHRERAVPGRSVVLKASYRRYREAPGGMDEIAEREGLAHRDISGPRRHRRLANAAAIARLLHEPRSSIRPIPKAVHHLATPVRSESALQRRNENPIVDVG